MVICSCNNLNEKKIQQAKAQGARSPHEAYTILGCSVRCGACCREACAILRAA